MNFLGELASFPEKIRDPDWLERVSADDHADGQPLRPSSGQEIKTEQERTNRRRKAKTQTMVGPSGDRLTLLARAQTMDVTFVIAQSISSYLMASACFSASAGLPNLASSSSCAYQMNWRIHRSWIQFRADGGR
jgi:hypothetical protein